MLELIIFILVLGVLVLAHEFGHFIVAKRAGMRVEEFGFGFPPRIFGYKYGETVYSLNLIPFGGFVRIYGEDGSDAENPRSFAGQGAGRKTAVILAGVVMNTILAAVLLFFANYVGLRTAVTPGNITEARDIKIHIFQVADNSPADEAGVMLLDEVVSLETTEEVFYPSTVEGIQEFVGKNQGEEVVLSVNRAGKTLNLPLVPRVNPPADEGPIGIALEATGVVSYGLFESLGRAFTGTLNLVIAVIMGLWEFFRLLFVELKLSEDVAGPVGIYFLTSQFAALGFGTFLAFVAQISVALAVLNVLPLVPLDGGRQLLIIIEKIRGRALSMRFQNSLALVGWVLLVTLIFFVTKQDIGRFF